MSAPVALEARSLGVAYGDRIVLRNVDLTLGAELMVVLGPNGAGKTTLLRALCGTLTPSSGVVTLDGCDLQTMSRADIARRIAVVPQELPPAEGFTAREVAAMGRAPHQGRWLRASQSDDAIVDDALSRCGAGDLGDRPFDQLSGGERKRVMVAQALSQQPSFLLLDEPAAFLDLKHGIDVFELLLSEVVRGIGVLAILHDLALAARYAERVALLVDGALQAPGSVDEVLMPENLQAAFGVDLQRFTDESGRPQAFAPRTNRRA